MRVSGWAWGTSESLHFESLFYWRSDDVIARHLDAFTMSKGVGNEGHARSWLLTEDDLRENLDDHSWRSKVSGVVFRDETGHGDIVRAAPKRAPLRRLPGKANCDWRRWLDSLLATLP